MGLVDTLEALGSEMNWGTGHLLNTTQILDLYILQGRCSGMESGGVRCCKFGGGGKGFCHHPLDQGELG